MAGRNRIVVNYGDMEDVVLLTVVDNNTGQELDIDHNFPTPKKYSFNSLEEILSYEEPNIEGFVLHYEDNSRVKIKTEEYKKLHRVLTGLNEKDIWESLKLGKFNELLEQIPDEMFYFVDGVRRELESKYSSIELSAKTSFVDLGDRKKNALWYQKQDYPSILFNMLDGKDYSYIIWKLIKPKVIKTYKIISEDSN